MGRLIARLAALGIAACAAVMSPAQAQAPALLVKDINTRVTTYGPQPWWGMVGGTDGGVLFQGCSDDGLTGCELWKSDGTPEGTALLKDIVPGCQSSLGYEWAPTNVNGTVYFVACSNAEMEPGLCPADPGPVQPTYDSDCELWKSDGTTAGTLRVKDINPGSVSSSPASFTEINGTLFFSASDAFNGRRLWKSDGTEAGTVPVNNAALSPRFLTDVSGTLFFLACPDDQSWNDDDCDGSRSELWKSDGTAAGTVRVRGDLVGGGPLIAVDGTLFFRVCSTAADPPQDCELWKSDGTKKGTVRVKDIAPGEGSGLPAYYPVPVHHLASVNGTLFFAACSVPGAAPGYATDCELWKSDGTTAGTLRVKDIAPGSASSWPSHLFDVNGTLVFRACASSGSCGLWKSDGTEAGTTLLRALSFGTSAPQTVNGRLFFGASSAGLDEELWMTDGTPAGTFLVKDIEPGGGGSFPDSLTDADGTLFFSAYDTTNGRELWKSDGSETGTVRVTTGVPGTMGSQPRSLVDANGRLFFVADDGVSGEELWTSDGTPAGTVLVKDIVPGSDSSRARQLTNVNGTLFFEACSVPGAEPGYATDCELWKSDGTTGGTVRVKDIVPGSVGSHPSLLTNVDGTLFFMTGCVEFGGSSCGLCSSCGLWTSDGTEAGTVHVKDVPEPEPGLLQSVGFSTNVNGRFFFVICSASSSPYSSGGNCALWTSDGTDVGTTTIKDDLGFPPKSLGGLDGALFFLASGALWRSDGTAAGTVVVTTVGDLSAVSVAKVDGTLVWTACGSGAVCELWRSDGTAAGTVRVTADLPRPYTNLTVANGTLFLGACVIDAAPPLGCPSPRRATSTGDVPADCEPWTSDGTEAGTRLLKDVWPGGESSFPKELTSLDGTLFFAAADGASGFELWRSDGTEACTEPLADVVPGFRGSYPQELTAVGGALFFSAVGEGTGRELWLVPPDSLLPCVPLPTTTSTTTTTLPCCELLTARKLLLTAKRPVSRSRLRFVSADPAISLGAGNDGSDDPVWHGGSLQIVTSLPGGYRIDWGWYLPANGWGYRKQTGLDLGYKFQAKGPFLGSVTIRPGKRIKVTTPGAPSDRLRVDPAPVDVVLTIGEHCYCFRFEETATFKREKKWMAKHAAAPSVCGAPAD